ncbi:hypothetical protein SCHPADRAFT_381477 [Schizopora paradoxa]|uniref:Uncharacterized protein n=1 Tax=Schizopora paradoxa TaxID=27342 RepID=A0A0H2RM93_9AGAM|nr:hypothetical protein SCHPADRAFT_381477 [Schizopora paradoxa]
MLSFMRMLLFVFLIISPLSTYSSFTLANVSIDDSAPDPRTGARITYGKIDNTTNGVGFIEGQNCQKCGAQPDPSQTFNRTWHAASVKSNGNESPFATVSFTGSAIYVMGIVVSSTPATNMSLNNSKIFFQVDGMDQGSFLYKASLGPEIIYSYNMTLFATENLSYGLHNVTITCGDGALPQRDPNSVCLLDRFIYTTRVDSEDSSSISGGPQPSNKFLF